MLLLAWSVPQAGACCVRISDEQAYLAADAVFVGTVEDIGRPRYLRIPGLRPISLNLESELGDRPSVRVRMAVSRVFKGTVTRRETVRTDGSSVGVRFRRGAEYLVFARGPRFATSTCSRTVEVVGPLPALLGAGAAPLATERVVKRQSFVETVAAATISIVRMVHPRFLRG